ncbi:cbb3-type cytochrome c oxidase N-terminal domain-containing protein [Flavihumibacter fluvii]|uniref:cbb3-type cytochrome c oxidase N-terminal domain-containing protein n=1 Tax=Flavihumibacter fluvii TaxID=2838157 RepID=UPI001BDE4862|nr:cbb3-type cytochrome c oxidase N-terminal domain-containing protein [Flavihumibacter fluvii]ULQ50828.1 c-type cytochrome [Flavihumibacter fluvii]
MLILLSATVPVFAKGAAGPAPVSSLENPLAITLLIIIFALALILALLAWVVNGAAGVFLGKLAKKSDSHGSSSSSIIGSVIILLMLVSPALFAQDATAAGAASASIAGLDKATFFIMLGIIGIELIGILYLLYNLQLLIRAEKVKEVVLEEAAVQAPKAPVETWWSKLNRFKPVEQEADIDLGHDYDGIRELDNKLPPWWLYGFYLTIIFGLIYLWRFQVTHTAPSSKEEYQIAMNEAAAQQEEYLKKSANKVDENSVVMLDAKGISAGQASYVASCAACHGKLGEGGVGPNLTDDYWIHGGKINDIFKTIKYGYPEKGMRAWKDEFSPVKIAEMASFIKSIHGTNPPNGKEKQGDLYSESAATSDSTAVTPTAPTISSPKDSLMVDKSAK